MSTLYVNTITPNSGDTVNVSGSLFVSGTINLGDANTAHLYALSQQGNSALTHQALMQQATAQAAMRDMETEKNIQVPKVNFYPSRHPDPHKARKKDIKQAYKLLAPDVLLYVQAM